MLELTLHQTLTVALRHKSFLNVWQRQQVGILHRAVNKNVDLPEQQKPFVIEIAEHLDANGLLTDIQGELLI